MFINPVVALCVYLLFCSFTFPRFICLCDHWKGRFDVRRVVDLMKTAKLSAYIMHIFGKIELLSIHAA